MKRPCGVSQTALRDEARIARIVRKKVTRAPRGLLLHAKKSEVFEKAVALEHRTVDRGERSAVREKLARRATDKRADPTTMRD